MSETAEDTRTEPVPEAGEGRAAEPLEGVTEPLRGRDVSPTEVRPKPVEQPEKPQGFLAAHRRTLVTLAIATAIVSFMVALSTMRAADKPSVNQASADVANLSLPPVYDPGDYGWQDTISLDSVDYVEVVRDPHTCTATGSLVYAGTTVSAEQRVAITYVRANNGGWMVEGGAELVKRSWTTETGADPDRVLAQTDVLLQKADIQAHTATGTSAALDQPTLYSLYRDASCTIASEEFDAEALTDTFILHFDDGGAFVAHSCDLTVKLRFRTGSGRWELVSCTADSHALDADYSPLVGTWTGSFATQDNDGHGCYGARTTPLTLHIDSVTPDEEGVITVSGSFAALVHHHGSLNADANESSGDVLLEGEPFTGTLETSSCGYVSSCVTPESADGVLRLELVFGTEISAHAARATLTTAYKHDESFLFLPYQVQGTFADNYALSRQDGEAES